MPSFRKQTLSGWGNVDPAESLVFRPERMTDLTNLLKFDANPLIARGQGRSYGDSAIHENAKVAISDHLSRFLEFDQASGRLTCEPGVTFEDIITTFLPRGFFPPVTPGTKFVSVGGAVAADVHGKNHHVDGSLGNFVQRLQLLTASGELLDCSRSQNTDVFWATIGGMGLTGIITEISLPLKKVESAFIQVNYTRLPNLEAVFQRISDNRHPSTYSVAWIDCLSSGRSLGRSVLMEGEHARQAHLSGYANKPFWLGKRRKSTIPIRFPNIVLNSLSVKAFNALYYATHRTTTGKIVHFDPFFYPLDSIHGWNKIYGKRGFVQYQALLPPDRAFDGITQLLKQISKSKLASFLAVLKSTGEANNGHLSFGKPGFTLALDIPHHGVALQELAKRLDDIVLKHDGRLYLAKDSLMSAESFAQMYPRLPEFREICSKLDPQKKFQSNQSKRLKIV